MIVCNLKALAKEKGVMQKELVAATGIRQPTVSALYNNSVKHIPLGDLDRICKFLKCQPGDIIKFEEH